MDDRIPQPAIEQMPGDSLICRAFHLGEMQQRVARRVLRRRYQEGVQLAFCYHDAWDCRLQLQRLRDFLNET